MKYKSLTELFAEAKATPFELNWDTLDESPLNCIHLIDAAKNAVRGMADSELIYMKLIHGEDVFQSPPWRLMPEEDRERHALATADELLNRYRVAMAGQTFVEVTSALTNA